MKYMEISKKITLSSEVTLDAVKDEFLKRLKRAVKVDRLDDKGDDLFLTGTTGGSAVFPRNTRVKLDVKFIKEDGVVRVFAYGYAKPAASLMFIYTLMFMVLIGIGMVLGMAHDTDGGSTVDALLFLLFGVLVLFDIEKRGTEPRSHLEDIFQSLETHFG